MHAYLLTGTNNEELKTKSEKLAQKLGIKVMEFPLVKIADTRELKNVTKLAFNTPTAIVINGIDQATEEAVNAFLKNLEEPQENIFYILTASNFKNVLPTITSRCEIIRLRPEKIKEKDKISENFLNIALGEKLAFIDKIKDRGEAKEFVKNLIEVLHFNLLNSNKKGVKTVMDLEILIKTLNNLKSNGNVQLQLVNMVISLE